MAFNRYKGTNFFDRSTPSDAGSTILKLTNKILADLQVDNISSQKDTQGVVRTSRSFSDPAGGSNTSQRGPHPAYYDPSVILQPAVRQYDYIRKSCYRDLTTAFISVCRETQT